MLIYDFPDAYDLFFPEDFIPATQSFFEKIIDKKKIRTALDCTCGTGQMTIPLSHLGLNVTAADINPNMLKRAKFNYAKENVMATFARADILSLEKDIKREFDCVLSTGNSLAHIPNDKLEAAIRQMDSVLRPGGMLFIDSRNWDLILQRQQRFYLFNPIIREKGRINYIQVWDYNRDGSMTFNFLIFEELDNKIVSKRQFYALYYPFSHQRIRDILEELQYQKIRFFKLGDPVFDHLEMIDWYVVTAEKPFPEMLQQQKKKGLFSF